MGVKANAVVKCSKEMNLRVVVVYCLGVEIDVDDNHLKLASID